MFEQMSEPVIKTKGLSKSYGDVHALKPSILKFRKTQSRVFWERMGLGKVRLLNFCWVS
jgi:ABC-type sugar transport system ATPase subunit